MPSASVDNDVAATDSEPILIERIVCMGRSCLADRAIPQIARPRAQKADGRHFRLLRTRTQRPRRRAAEQRNELTPL